VIHALFADGVNAPPDQGVSTFLFIGLALFGAVAYGRLRRGWFTALPKAAGWASAGTAVACLVLAFVLPPIIRPVVNTRPSTDAKISFIVPANGEVFHGNPAKVPVAVRLTGGKIVPFISTHLIPNEGHIHLYLDGNIVLMSFGTRTSLQVEPGRHKLTAEFVAVDHGPWDPRVLANDTIVVRR
jgi:hypothetical protein